MKPLLPSPLAPLQEGEGNIVALMRDLGIEKGLSAPQQRDRYACLPSPPGRGTEGEGGVRTVYAAFDSTTRHSCINCSGATSSNVTSTGAPTGTLYGGVPGRLE